MINDNFKIYTSGLKEAFDQFLEHRNELFSSNLNPFDMFVAGYLFRNNKPLSITDVIPTGQVTKPVKKSCDTCIHRKVSDKCFICEDYSTWLEDPVVFPVNSVFDHMTVETDLYFDTVPTVKISITNYDHDSYNLNVEDAIVLRNFLDEFITATRK